MYITTSVWLQTTNTSLIKHFVKNAKQCDATNAGTTMTDTH